MRINYFKMNFIINIKKTSWSILIINVKIAELPFLMKKICFCVCAWPQAFFSCKITCFVIRLAASVFFIEKININALVWIGIVVIFVFVLDYFLQIYGIKKAGGKKHAVRGSVVGMLLGFFFFPPFGIFAGAFIGAFIGAKIEQLWEFTEEDGMVVQQWCQGTVVTVKKNNRVHIEWDELCLCDGDSKITQEKFLKMKWNKQVNEAWRMNMEG